MFKTKNNKIAGSIMGIILLAAQLWGRLSRCDEMYEDKKYSIIKKSSSLTFHKDPWITYLSPLVYSWSVSMLKGHIGRLNISNLLHREYYILYMYKTYQADRPN